MKLTRAGIHCRVAAQLVILVHKVGLFTVSTVLNSKACAVATEANYRYCQPLNHSPCGTYLKQDTMGEVKWNATASTLSEARKKCYASCV